MSVCDDLQLIARQHLPDTWESLRTKLRCRDDDTPRACRLSLALNVHPDKVTGDDGRKAEEVMKRINDLWDRMDDADARKPCSHVSSLGRGTSAPFRAPSPAAFDRYRAERMRQAEAARKLAIEEYERLVQTPFEDLKGDAALAMWTGDWERLRYRMEREWWFVWAPVGELPPDPPAKRDEFVLCDWVPDSWRPVPASVLDDARRRSEQRRATGAEGMIEFFLRQFLGVFVRKDGSVNTSSLAMDAFVDHFSRLPNDNKVFHARAPLLGTASQRERHAFLRHEPLNRLIVGFLGLLTRTKAPTLQLHRMANNVRRAPSLNVVWKATRELVATGLPEAGEGSEVEKKTRDDNSWVRVGDTFVHGDRHKMYVQVIKKAGKKTVEARELQFPFWRHDGRALTRRDVFELSQRGVTDVEHVSDEPPPRNLFADSEKPKRFKAKVEGPVHFLEGRRSGGLAAVRFLRVGDT